MILWYINIKIKVYILLLQKNNTKFLFKNIKITYKMSDSSSDEDYRKMNRKAKKS